jgi:hypothetical protein
MAGKGNTPEDKNSQSYKVFKEHLPIITCDCGAEILLVPNLRAMNLAIKAHVAEHRKEDRNAQVKAKTGNINQLLSQLTLIKMSEIVGT